MDHTLTFVSTPQAYPEIRPAERRTADFQEIYKRFTAQGAITQSSRCSQCGVPFCQVHCPLGNDIPDWLRLTAEGRLQDAYEISSATNSLPEICGRICPQDRLCEGNCVIEKDFGAVTIGSVEKYLTENAFDEGWVKPPSPSRENGRSVGIIGAGPAGFAAADRLRRRGFAVHIYDRYDRAGGLMIYGIPNFKLEKSVVARRHALLTEAGVQFHLNFEVGRDASLADLRVKHEAVLIATGVYQARKTGILDMSLSGIHPALSYLTSSNRAGLGDIAAPAALDHAAGKSVIVIGGGDTAMDCVRTAIRQGARKVTCLYRRDRGNMPGSAREVKHAEDEGVEFLWLSAPHGFAGNERVETVLASRMRLGAPELGGRRTPMLVENSHFSLHADLVIEALGFDPEPLPGLFGAPELATTARGTLKVDAQGMTSIPGVFAAGDIVRGASLVVWAVKDGQDAALAMERWIGMNAERKAA